MRKGPEANSIYRDRIGSAAFCAFCRYFIRRQRGRWYDV